MSYLFPPQCIVCEGERDRIVLAELAARVLRVNSISRQLEIFVANGKIVIPRLVQAAEAHFPPNSVIVVVDSEGHLDATRRMLERSLPNNEPWIVIANPYVESWITDRPGKLHPDNLRDAAAQADLSWIEARHPEFRVLREAVTSLPLPR
jgi:hypothetical protein